jgi:DNA topoisomerase-1
MVAVLCNHQRAASKQHAEQMEKMDGDLEGIKTKLSEKQKELKVQKKGDKDPKKIDALKRQIETLEMRLKKKEISKVDKEENKSIALSTSMLNYLDPRISAQCTTYCNVPLSRVYNKTQQLKFKWAIAFIQYETDVWEF